MKCGNLNIDWIEKSGKPCLKFTFGQNLTEKDAGEAIVEWRKAFQSKMGQAIVLIWDCREMKGYESAARVNWQSALKEMKSQIDTIWLITESNFIKMGASVMSMFSSLEIKVVSSEDEIKF